VSLVRRDNMRVVFWLDPWTSPLASDSLNKPQMLP
jgi:hypothetical protein